MIIKNGTLLKYTGKEDTVIVPEDVHTIGKGAFAANNVREVILLPGVTRIEEDAFCACESLIDIVLPDSITDIGESAFSRCKALKIVTIPTGVTRIRAKTFRACTSLEQVILHDGITEIGERAFDYCLSLKSIELPQRLERIGDCAFEDCGELREITRPFSVRSIGKNAFAGCPLTEPDDIHEVSTVWRCVYGHHDLDSRCYCVHCGRTFHDYQVIKPAKAFPCKWNSAEICTGGSCGVDCDGYFTVYPDPYETVVCKRCGHRETRMAEL